MRKQFLSLTFPHIGGALSPVIPLVRGRCACNHGGLSLDVPQHTREAAMKSFKVMVLVASFCVLPSAFAATDRVLGEKLDSGLGQLGASYTAWEYMPKGRLLGESLDNGLGSLGADYTAWEYMPAGPVLGESLDSGLGSLGSEYTAWEFMPADRVLGESLDSGLGSLTREDLEQYMPAQTVRTALSR